MGEIEKTEQEPRREISEQAKEVIRLFQEAGEMLDEETRIKLLHKFHGKLQDILAPGSDHYELSDEGLEEAISGRVPLGVAAAARTSGQRIFFERSITVPQGENPSIYGPDLTPTEMFGEYYLDSKDKKTRWMRYPKPSDNDWEYGKDYWTRFHEHFGQDIVDLFQKLENKK